MGWALNFPIFGGTTSLLVVFTADILQALSYFWGLAGYCFCFLETYGFFFPAHVAAVTRRCV